MSEKLKVVNKTQSRLLVEHYQKAIQAKAEGRPVVYVSALFPVEIVRAFEPHVAIVYPENHAVMMITRGQHQLVKRAEAEEGMDRMGCAYELINTGYLLSGHGNLETEDLLDNKGRPLLKLPEPDILLACDNQCRVICEWFKNISEICGNKPFKMINVGDRFDGSLGGERIKYVISQLKELIAFLEEQTGITLDRDRLLSVAETSWKALQLWRDYLNLGTRVPSPVTIFDGFYHMGMIVSERGNPHTVDYYSELIEAVEEAERMNLYPVKEERHRLLWDNLPTWYNYRELQNMFSKYGLAVVGSVYLQSWFKALDPFNYENLLESMAISYSTIYPCLTIPQRIEAYIRMVEEFSADGVLFHKNLSCHTVSLRVENIAKKLNQHFGGEFRTVVFEGCQGIKGRFQEQAFETGVEVHFIER